MEVEEKLVIFQRHIGKMRKRGTDPLWIPIIEEDRFLLSPSGAEIIRKVYETDTLLCPSCGAQMHIIAFIEDNKVIDKIIRHRRLTFHTEHPPPPQVVLQELLVVAEDRGENF